MSGIDVQHEPEGICVLRASGEIDFAETERLLPQLRRVAADTGGVLLDLTDVTFFDSSGVRLVDQLARSCRVHSTAFRVVAPVGGVPRRVLEIVGMVSSVTVEDAAAGLAALRGN